MDDDGDGLIDCEDPDCSSAGFACVNLPPGWFGPAALYDGAPNSLPTCGGAYTMTELTAKADAQGSPAVCACSCSNAVGTCAFAFSTWDDTSCTAVPPVAPNFMQINTCNPVTYGVGIRGFRVPPVAPMFMSACAPSSAPPDIPPVTWLSASLLCSQPPAGGCASGKVCAGTPPPKFRASVCIWQPGDQTCPAGYPTKRPLSENGTTLDNRGCSPCACTAPPYSCSQTMSFYADANCTNNVSNVPSDGTCAPSGGDIYSAKVTVPWSLNLTCTPAGGVPTGKVVEVVTTTVCCNP